MIVVECESAPNVPDTTSVKVPLGVFLVVDIVSCAVELDVPFKVTEPGESEQVESAGAPLQLSETV